MLEFFRKYQRYFFIFITAIVIASFSFFGTFTTFAEKEKRDETVVGYALDGSPILSYEVYRLARFISLDREDPPQGRGMMPNFMNDGVVRYDFLQTGLADLLVSSYFDPLKPSLQSRLEKAKRFRPYFHPEAQGLSAKAVWDRYAPSINIELSALQLEAEATPATFARLCKLYQQQSFLQPELLRRILMFQLQQNPGLQLDPRLAQDDLSLFGFHTLGEWFGDDFINLAAQFILNSAALAEKKGYKVSIEEAKGDLIRNFEISMDKLASAQIKPDLTFKQHLRMQGLDERSAAEIWQKILLFRRYFQDVGGSAFLDQLAFRDFADYSMETAIIQKYEWPEALRFKTFEDLLEFQVYLKAIAKPGKDPLALPSVFCSLEEVEKNFPELVQTDYKILAAEVSKSQIGLRASLKEVWEWEAQEHNWEILKNEFSFLPKTTSSEIRFQILDKLDGQTRSRIDAFARERLVDQNPDWVEEALSNARKIEKCVAVSGSADSPSLRFMDVEESGKMAALLARAQNKDPEAAAGLRCFSDGSTFFRIESVEKSKDKHILTFEKARSILPQMTDRFLQEEYRKRSLKFLTSDGQSKPFSQVKEEVGLAAFSELFKAMDKLESGSQDSKGQPFKSKREFYTAYRLVAPARSALDDLKKNPEDARWIASKEEDPFLDPLAQQFKLERNEIKIQRNSKEDLMKEEAFVMMPNQWSPVRVADENQIVFFYLHEKKQADTPILDLLSFGKEILACDAQRYLAERLIETAKEKNAIVVPLQGEKE